MKILMMDRQWVPFGCGGSEVMAHQMLRFLAARGHNVDVLLSVPTGHVHEPYEIDGVMVYPRQGPADPTRWFHSQTDKPDVVVTQHADTARASILGKMYGVPVVQLCHNTLSNTVNSLRRHPPALAVYNSDYMRTHLESLVDEKYPSIVVRPPVDPQEYATTPGDKVTLVNVIPYKGSETFYRVARAMPDTQFLGVVGGWTEKPVIKELPNVEIVPHVPSGNMPKEVYSRTRLLMVPSYYESWGRVAAEAMCSGIPVLAHPTPGIEECLGGAGFLIDRDDSDSWIKQIRTLQKKTAYDKASRAARKRAKQFDPTAELELWATEVERLHGYTPRHPR